MTQTNEPDGLAAQREARELFRRTDRSQLDGRTDEAAAAEARVGEAVAARCDELLALMAKIGVALPAPPLPSAATPRDRHSTVSHLRI
jgi:hypothetical protein